MKKIAIATLGAIAVSGAFAQSAPAVSDVGLLFDYTGALAEPWRSSAPTWKTVPTWRLTR